MATSLVRIEVPNALNVEVSEERLTVELSDGRTLSVPLVWFPRLVHATPAERANWELIVKGEGIHWEDLDEDISVEHLLAGYPSMEIQESLRRWLEDRKRRLVPNTEDFRSALHSKLQEAVKQGITYLDINSGEFHREPGGSSGRNNRLPVCCNVMWQEMREGDEVLERPPKGKGASLTIRYQLPRK